MEEITKKEVDEMMAVKNKERVLRMSDYTKYDGYWCMIDLNRKVYEGELIFSLDHRAFKLTSCFRVESVDDWISSDTAIKWVEVWFKMDQIQFKDLTLSLIRKKLKELKKEKLDR